mmetsp:Transcript_18778/g.52468  ORF Transcript_18778/g.52468 Transcript_18778/m.52468 type:complete len:86 (+) Transcript_18778:723-980(+)
MKIVKLNTRHTHTPLLHDPGRRPGTRSNETKRKKTRTRLINEQHVALDKTLRHSNTTFEEHTTTTRGFAKAAAFSNNNNKNIIYL